MCSPELMRGICQICFGALAPENTEVNSDVHRGKCAILAGIVPAEHRERADQLIRQVHGRPPNSRSRRAATRRYYKFVDSIATVDFYDYQ